MMDPRKLIEASLRAMESLVGQADTMLGAGQVLGILQVFLRCSPVPVSRRQISIPG